MRTEVSVGDGWALAKTYSSRQNSPYFLEGSSGEPTADLHSQMMGESSLPAVWVLMVKANPSIACVFLDHPFEDRFITRSRGDIAEVGLDSSWDGRTGDGLGLACRMEMNILICLFESARERVYEKR